jgi:hypothetical protein
MEKNIIFKNILPIKYYNMVKLELIQNFWFDNCIRFDFGDAKFDIRLDDFNIDEIRKGFSEKRKNIIIIEEEHINNRSMYFWICYENEKMEFKYHNSKIENIEINIIKTIDWNEGTKLILDILDIYIK